MKKNKAGKGVTLGAICPLPSPGDSFDCRKLCVGVVCVCAGGRRAGLRFLICKRSALDKMTCKRSFLALTHSF